MYGALTGDICGSIYQWDNRKTETPEEIDLPDSNCYFTDDSVLTVGAADSLLSGSGYKAGILKSTRKYPKAEYGGSFWEWFYKEIPVKPAGFISTKISDDMKQVINEFHEKYLQRFGLNYRIKEKI